MICIPIVLTATIIPTFGSIPSTEELQKRRIEYLTAIEYYAKRAKSVYFLENSKYDLSNDELFFKYKNVRIRHTSVSIAPERGKGYQEFEMLDQWVKSEKSMPSSWIKITGRYIIENIEKISEECSLDESYSLVIDQAKFAHIARTYLFFSTTQFYFEKMYGLFAKCNDTSGEWIERVLFRELSCHAQSNIRYFINKPILHATQGGDGKYYPSNVISNTIKQWLRNVNRNINKKYLLFAR